MKEIVALFSPQWWTFKNQLFRSDRTAYIKAVLVVLLGAGFWSAAIHFLNTVFDRLHGMEGNIGNIVALKGLALLLMVVFFLLIFSSLLSSIKNYYLASDLPQILSSPVSWENIYFSKWLETAIKSSWMILFAILPVFIALGIFLKAPFHFYIILLPTLLMFTFISAGIGISTGIIIMAAVPAKRAKNIFIVLGIIVFIIIMLLFRFLRPERFANPEWFANLTIFLAEMKAPVSALFPGMWVTETLTSFLYAKNEGAIFFALLLFFTAGAFIIFGNWLFNTLYYRGLVKAQQSHRHNIFTSGFMYRLLSKIILIFSGTRNRALVEKDLITFFRSVGQWSQMLLLSAIVIIYLFSIRALPVEWGTYLGAQLKYIISFLNIGLVCLVITAVAVRLVLPSVDNEGPAFWIIRVSPLSMRRFLWNKFITAFIPLLILSQVLIVVSNIFLGVKAWFMFLGAGTGVVLAASITGLAVGTGAYTAKFSTVETERDQTGFRGTVYMLLSLAVILITILHEVIPVSIMFVKETGSGALSFKGWAITGLLFLSVLILNAVILWTAMKTGEKRLVNIER